MKTKSKIIFFLFLILFLVSIISFTIKVIIPHWDAAVYLENARDWVSGKQIYEPYKHQGLSFLLIPIINNPYIFSIMNFVSPFFCILSLLLLWKLCSNKLGDFFLLFVILLCTNPYYFFYSAELWAESACLFFLLLFIYGLSKETTTWNIIAGLAGAFTFIIKYPIATYIAIYSLYWFFSTKDKKKIMYSVALPMVILVSIFIMAMILKTGSFQYALEKDTKFSIFHLSPFYIVNFFNYIGYVGISFLFSFLFFNTYTQQDKAIFFMIIGGVIFWSMNISNQQIRFMYQLIPFIYYFCCLTILNLYNNNKTVFSEEVQQ